MKALALISIGLVSGGLTAGSYACGRDQATVTSEALGTAPTAGERTPSLSTHGPPAPQPAPAEDGSEGQAPGPAPGMATRPAMPAGNRARGTAPGAAAGATPSAPRRAMADAGAAPKPAEHEGCETRGLQLSGLMYSPGGDRLPYPCKPFHPTENNPFAVRCIDAWPWYDTGFPGDEFCILPPTPGAGVQYGVHPQGPNWHAQVSSGDMSGYERSKLGYFYLAQGQEEQSYYNTRVPTVEDREYYRSSVRTRTGTHHLVSSVASEGATLGWVLPPGTFFGGRVRLPEAHGADENVPQSLAKPDEDAGLYSPLPGGATVAIELHHFNPTDGDILKETWTNLWWTQDAATQVERTLGLPFAQTLATTLAEPGQTVDLHYSWSIGSDVRLIDVVGHHHVWTASVSAWVDAPGAAPELIYQSFDWRDIPRYRYDSVSVNPAPDRERRIDGASSGTRILKAGQKLHFNCHLAYTPERAAAEGMPTPSSLGTLRFGNQATRSEMCMLLLSVAGGTLGSPSPDSEPVPAFATLN